ncbi:MAG: hypothetical protein WCE79_17280 [Xanthobacteraceae bacterium]
MGFHPIAVRLLVEYLIDVAERRSLQVIFTTHSDHALTSLPDKAVWACLDGRVEQGKLSVEATRAISGRAEQRLAIFVEDKFAAHWISTVLRGPIGAKFDEMEVYPVGGDNKTTQTHRAHMSNPSRRFGSICFVDGDSDEKEDEADGIFRLPGGAPEETVFDSVWANLPSNITRLADACQAPSEAELLRVIESVARTNRDRHLLWEQIGERLGRVPAATIAGGFLRVWTQTNPEAVEKIVERVTAALGDRAQERR